MIKYKVEWENDPVDIQYLQDHYYWHDYEDFESFTHWMWEHEKDGSVKELDVISADEAKEIAETATQLRTLSDKLYNLFDKVDGHSIDENIKEFRVLRLIDDFVNSVISNVYKLEREY